MESQELYDKYNEGNHWEKHPTVYAERFVEFLNGREFDGLIVDAGCGNGRDVKVFSQNGLDVIGVDNSEEHTELARKACPNCSFEDMRFENKSVSAIFCINLIHYVNKEKTLREFKRVLKEGGYLFIHFNIEIKDKEGNLDYSHSEEDILKLVSGFEVVDKKIITREGSFPVEHTHKIMELILKK